LKTTLLDQQVSGNIFPKMRFNSTQNTKDLTNCANKITFVREYSGVRAKLNINEFNSRTANIQFSYRKLKGKSIEA